MKLLGIFAVLLLASCATAYKPSGLGGGYSEQDVGNGVTAISFRGNGYTNSDTAGVYALRRANEYCQEQGKKGYEVISGQKTNHISSNPFQFTTCQTSGTTSGNSYNAHTNCQTPSNDVVVRPTATVFIRCTDS